MIVTGREHRSPAPARRRMLQLLLGGLVVLFGLLFTAAPASAHAVLLRTAPTAGTILDSAPTEVKLTFNEPVDIRLGRLTVVDPKGKSAVRGKARRSGPDVTIPLRAGLGRGTYVVSYRVVSADGHPVSGGYTFSILVPSAQSSQVTTGGGSADVDPLVRGIQSAGRYAAYAGAALLAGPLVFLVLLWPRRFELTGPRRLAWTGWGLLFGGTLVALLLQAPYSTGGSLTDVSGSDVLNTLQSGVGKALAFRLGCLIAGTVVVARITRAVEMTLSDKIVACMLAVATLLTWPFAGHAVASPAPLLSVPSDALHVAAMSIWLGGLVMLLRYLLPRANEAELGAIMPIWSRWAMYAVVALAFTGTIQALLELGSFGALVTTLYGQLVVAKIIGLGLVVLAASFARSWVRHRYVLPVAHAFAAEEGHTSTRKGMATQDGSAVSDTTVDETTAADSVLADADVDDADVDDGVLAVGGLNVGRDEADEDEAGEYAEDGKSAAVRNGQPIGRVAGLHAAEPDEIDEAAAVDTWRLRRAVVAEILIAALVLVVATALVQTTPGRNARASAASQQNLPYSATAKTSLFELGVDIAPAARGNNTVHLTAFSSTGQPVKVLEWKATATNQKVGIGPVTINLLVISDNHAVGEVQLPVAGDWTFSFTGRTSDINQETVKETVRIN